MRVNFKRLVNRVIKKLKDEGVDCYLWHSANTGSAYIIFKNSRVGSVRLADHKGGNQYGYKWNIRSDFPHGHSKWHKVNGIWRYYVHTSDWIDIIPLIVIRNDEVKTWVGDPKPYYVPTHKIDLGKSLKI